MTTRENDLLLQFMEMVFPKDLLRYFELTDFREEAVSEKDRFGVESGELGSGGKPCVLRIDFLQSKKKVFHVRYASQLGSEVFYLGIERFGRGIG